MEAEGVVMAGESFACALVLIVVMDPFDTLAEGTDTMLAVGCFDIRRCGACKC